MFQSWPKRLNWSNARSLSLLLMMWLLCCALTIAQAQNKSPDKQAKALARSADAARILETVMASSDRAIASNLFEKAKAVAVFPRLTKKIVFIDQFIYGQGIATRRTQKGWGIPFFLNFKGGDIGLRLWGSEASDVIIIFMTEESAQWLLKDKLQLKLKSNLVYREGVVSKPVGKMTDAELASSGIKVIVYKVTKDGFAEMEALTMDLSPDDDLNRGVYKMKAHDILLDQQGQAGQGVPEGMFEFTRALARYTSLR
jgi:lipid-binding SYLF domain-containing protein